MEPEDYYKLHKMKMAFQNMVLSITELTDDELIDRHESERILGLYGLDYKELEGEV